MGPSKKVKSPGTPPSKSSQKVIKPLAPARNQPGVRNSPYRKPEQHQHHNSILGEMTPPTAQPEADTAANGAFLNKPFQPVGSSPYDGLVSSPNAIYASFDENSLYGLNGSESSDMMAQLAPAQNFVTVNPWDMPDYMLHSSPFDTYPDQQWQLAVEDRDSGNIEDEYSWLVNGSENYSHPQVHPTAFNDTKRYRQVFSNQASTGQMFMNSVSEPAISMDDLYSQPDPLISSSNVPPLTFDHSSPEDYTDQAEFFPSYPVATDGEEQTGSTFPADEELVGVGLYGDRDPSNRKFGPKDSQYQVEKSEKAVTGRKGLVLEETWQPPVNQFFGPPYNGQSSTLYPADCTQGAIGYHDLLVTDNTNPVNFNPQGITDNYGDTQEPYTVYNGFTDQDFPMQTFPDLSIEEEDITAFFGGEHILDNGWPLDPTATSPSY